MIWWKTDGFCTVEWWNVLWHKRAVLWLCPVVVCSGQEAWYGGQRQRGVCDWCGIKTSTTWSAAIRQWWWSAGELNTAYGPCNVVRFIFKEASSRWLIVCIHYCGRMKLNVPAVSLLINVQMYINTRLMYLVRGVIANIASGSDCLRKSWWVNSKLQNRW